MQLTARQLHGLDSTSAELMGKPSIGAHYQREDYRSQKVDDGACCAICGRRAADAHHIVHRGYSRGFTVDTPLGRFVTLSPLIALCRGCHEEIHSRARYSFRWEWRAPQYQAEWWSGHTLAHICRPGGEFLKQEGWLVLIDRQTGEERRLEWIHTAQEK